MKIRRLLYMLALTVSIGFALNGDSFGQLVVDDDGQATFNNCNASAATFNTVQAAVTAAPAGTTIRVCPGTYQEQVTVPPGKNNIKLVSVRKLEAIIKAPVTSANNTTPFDLITVNGSTNVSLTEFTVTGPFPDSSFCNTFLISGVRVVGNGSANILRNHITKMWSANPALRGCQNGFAIAVGRSFEGQSGRANIGENLIDTYQKGGIYVDNVGSSASITGNKIIGEGPINTIGQNGIQISRGATADIYRNGITDNVYITPTGGDPTSASAVIIFEAGQIVAEKNKLRRNQDGFGVYTQTGTVTIEKNSIFGGIPAFSPTLGNIFFGDGIYMDSDTSNNRLLKNNLRGNNEHDCHDASVGTKNPPANVANFWIGNTGQTENKPGLCNQRSNGDDDNDDHEGDDS